LLDIEKQIENCYNVMAKLEMHDYKKIVSTSEIINSIKKLRLLKTVVLVNINNLLTEVQKRDMDLYACDIADTIDELDKINLLVDDEDFCDSDIAEDAFLKSIFVMQIFLMEILLI